jgi:phthiocerol/phenolphthiocerol synthesis type-I polyketide synthase E
VYLPGAGAAPSFLALAVPQLAGDHASCTILATDIRIAFAHRLAGEAISLQSVPTSWHEWSQRCAERAQHSSASEHLDFDFEKFAHATLRVVDHDIASRPHASDLARLSAPMTNMLTTELDEAQRYLRLTTEEILIAALGRTIARTIGQGLVAIDVAGDSRFVLDTSVDLRRTVGWFTTTYPVAIDCITDRRASATEMVGAVHRTLAAVAHRVYAPPAPHRAGQRSSDILFSYIGGGLEPSAALSVRETLPALGHALEVRVYRNAGQLHMDWWYDTRRFFDSTVEELSEQFPLALIELTSEAMPPNDEAEIVVATWR